MTLGTAMTPAGHVAAAADHLLCAAQLTAPDPKRQRINARITKQWEATRKLLIDVNPELYGLECEACSRRVAKLYPRQRVSLHTATVEGQAVTEYVFGDMLHVCTKCKNHFATMLRYANLHRAWQGSRERGGE